MLTRITAFLADHPRWTALIAGCVSATGFAPLGLWPLTLIALALLLWLLENAPTKRRAFNLGYLWAVGHFAIGLNWIATAFTYQAAMPAWLGWIAVVLLAFYLAVFPGLAAMSAWWGASYLSPSPSGEGSGWGLAANTVPAGTTPPPSPPLKGRDANRLPPLLLLFAATWIITEWLRSWVFTGFAWNPLAASVVGTLLPQFTPQIGTYGVSGLFVTVAGLSLILFRYTASGRARAQAVQTGSIVGLVFGVIFIAPLIVVFSAPWLLPDRPPPLAGTPVTIVQPNIEQGDKWDMAARSENFRKLARLSPRRTGAPPRLLLWPEAAVPDYLEGGYPQQWYVEPASFTRARLSSLLGPDDLLLTGAVRLETGNPLSPAQGEGQQDVLGARNSLFVLDAQGQLGPRYDKAHLVPFGEYLPLRAMLAPLGLSRLAPGAVDFWPGPGPRTLNLSEQGFGRVGVQICYEIIFSGQVVDRANRPDFIFNPSNDAWFGSWGPPQHLAQARLRAIEEGLPVVRSTPTGISAIIDGSGRILESIPQGVAGRIDARLPLPHAPTLFARYGNILPLLLAVFLVGIAIAIDRRRR